MRVVSLVPSVTETLLAWRIEPIACTRFCEQPGLRTVGGTKNPDVDAIVELDPDLVVVDEEENRREDADSLTAAGVPVHVTAVRSLADVAPTLGALAGAVGATPDVPTVVPVAPTTGHTAFVPIWRRPWMTINGDTYGSSLLACIGVGNVFGAASDRYPTVALDEVAGRRPDLVVVPTEPYAFTELHLRELADAVGARAVLVDGKDLFWWGVRTSEAVERLRQHLDPGTG